MYEATNVLFRFEKGGLIPKGASLEGLRTVQSLNIILVNDFEIHLNALEFALRFNLGAAYDGHFLALADREQCEFWTSDKRLFNATHRRFPLIRLIDHESA